MLRSLDFILNVVGSIEGFCQAGEEKSKSYVSEKKIGIVLWLDDIYQIRLESLTSDEAILEENSKALKLG